MKASIPLPLITYLTLTSAAAAPPQAAAPSKPTDLTPAQWSALKGYTEPQATEAAMSSVNAVLATAAVKSGQVASQEANFRAAALATPKPQLPLYVQYMPKNQQSYLSSYYAMQASIINKAGQPSAIQTAAKTTAKGAKSSKAPNAQILPDVTGPAKAPASTKGLGSTANGTTKTTVSPSQSPGAKTSAKLQPTTTTNSTPSGQAGTKSTSNPTAKSTSSKAGAAAQQTGMAKAAGLSMLGIAGVAALL